MERQVSSESAFSYAENAFGSTAVERKHIWTSLKNCRQFGATHVMASAFKSLQTLQIRRPKSVCLDLSLFEIKDTSISPPLRPPRTDFVSLCKTKHSSAEVLISVALRGGGGGSFPGGAILLLYKTSTFCVCPIPRLHPKCASLVLRRSIWHTQKWLNKLSKYF